MPSRKYLTERDSRLCIRYMPKTNNSDSRTHIRTALQDRSEALWLPTITQLVAQIAWTQLESEIGLTCASYGTTRLLRRNPIAARLILARCSSTSNKVSQDGTGEIIVEVLPHDIARQVAGPNVRFLEGQKFAGSIQHRLEESLSFLGTSMQTAVCTLVRSVHIIDPGKEDTDVSFSHPAIPFSIFVSVPRKWSEVSALRVAEAMLHEAMHLQLTLVHRVVALLIPQQKKYYSPWRDDYRPAEGILQGLYAFRVIYSFFDSLRQLADRASAHVAHRMDEISRQIEQLQDFWKCDELTSDGAALAVRLLDLPTRGRGNPRDPTPWS